MDDGRKVITIAHPEQSSGELKKEKMQSNLYSASSYGKLKWLLKIGACFIEVNLHIFDSKRI